VGGRWFIDICRQTFRDRKDALLAFASAQESRPDVSREDAPTLGVVSLPQPFSPALLAGLAWPLALELAWA